MKTIKPILSVILVFLFAFSTFGCRKGAEIDIPDDVQNAENTGDADTENLSIVSSSKYYTLNEKGEYYIYNKDHEVVKSGEDPRANISMLNSGVVKFYSQAGTGISTRYNFYYDAYNDRFSETFHSVHDEYASLIAYGTAEKVTVQNMFDKAEYYREFSDFNPPLSTQVVEPITSVNFVNSGRAICVTYITGDNYEEKTVIFDLNGSGPVKNDLYLDFGYLNLGDETEFGEFVIDNPIDAAFSIEAGELAGTTQEFVEVNVKFKDIWQAELEYSLNNLKEVLSEEQILQLENIQANWKEYVNESTSFENGILYYDGAMRGTFTRVLYNSYVRELYRERTLRIKYLHFILERDMAERGEIGEDEYKSITFLYSENR